MCMVVATLAPKLFWRIQTDNSLTIGVTQRCTAFLGQRLQCITFSPWICSVPVNKLVPWCASLLSGVLGIPRLRFTIMIHEIFQHQKYRILYTTTRNSILFKQLGRFFTVTMYFFFVSLNSFKNASANRPIRDMSCAQAHWVGSNWTLWIVLY